MKTPCSLFGQSTNNQQVYQPGFYSRILNYKDNITTLNIDSEDYITRAVSGTKVNIVNVFNP